ncbi:hypothetical protein GQ44DRAFT_697420 [Phaeosphaeriaceae sp. PMI808]|nr:hypothetical protein GQ44DRAFT_697420 [Phaeosphaeriaceae sp. PMI808]
MFSPEPCPHPSYWNMFSPEPCPHPSYWNTQALHEPCPHPSYRITQALQEPVSFCDRCLVFTTPSSLPKHTVRHSGQECFTRPRLILEKRLVPRDG